MKRYYIWDFERNMWWKPSNFGYTLEVKKAGQYSEQEALEITINANKYQGSDVPNTAMVPVEDYDLLHYASAKAAHD